MKEVQAGGPSAPGQQKAGQGPKAAAPAQSGEAAAKFREEELALQKAGTFLLCACMRPSDLACRSNSGASWGVDRQCCYLPLSKLALASPFLDGLTAA